MGMDEWEGSAVTWAELREKQLSPDSVWARRIPSFLQKIPSLPYRPPSGVSRMNSAEGARIFRTDRYLKQALSPSPAKKPISFSLG